jgi:autotransporter-associated beta strand protein
MPRIMEIAITALIKRIFLTVSLSCAAIVLSLSVSTAQAANKTWNNTGTDFNAAGTWNGGALTAADVALFNAAAVTQPNLTGSITIQELNFSATTSSGYTLSATSPFALTLTNTGTGATSAINAANTSGTNLISTPIVLGGAAASLATFTQASGGTLVLSGNISSTNAITGLALTNSGIITLSGSNSYSGTTSLSGGTLNINSNSALGTGDLVINGGTINNSSGSAKSLTNGVTVANNFTFTGNNDLTFGGAGTISGNGRVMTVSASRLTVNNGVNWGALSGTTATQKSGTGTLVLNGAGGLAPPRAAPSLIAYVQD